MRYVPTVDSITVPSGWLMWSDDHPPHGLPPDALLLRRGYRLGAPTGVGGMWDYQRGRLASVVARPFTRIRP